MPVTTDSIFGFCWTTSAPRMCAEMCTRTQTHTLSTQGGHSPRYCGRSAIPSFLPEHSALADRGTSAAGWEVCLHQHGWGRGPSVLLWESRPTLRCFAWLLTPNFLKFHYWKDQCQCNKYHIIKFHGLISVGSPWPFYISYHKHEM